MCVHLSIWVDSFVHKILTIKQLACSEWPIIATGDCRMFVIGLEMHQVCWGPNFLA